MTKFNERFFCPAPWVHMHYHISDTSPCHLTKTGLELSPKDYLQSDWLKNIKQDFVNGVVPKCCENSCKAKEELGIKSTRGAFWKYNNIGEAPEMDISQYTVDQETKPRRIELRFSNLCNFKCRMCDERFSSEIVKEKKKFNIPLKRIPLNAIGSTKSIYISDSDDMEMFKSIALDNLTTVCFTGGEPFLMKQNYAFMDYLIEKQANKNIRLEVFTNCSTYNPEFINRMLQFKEVNLAMSLDAAGATAEYQRHGTKWKEVSKNALRFVTLPIEVDFTSAISAYTLLDASSHAKFLMELYNRNPKLGAKCYTVNYPVELHFLNLNHDLRVRAIKEIDLTLEILTPDNFNIYKNELKNIRRKLIEKNTSKTRENLFAHYTKQLDEMRNESFESVFGYKLY